MTFEITRKPLRIELTYLKLQTENAYTFGLGCSTMIIMVFELTNKIFSSGFNIKFVWLRLSPSVCQILAIRHLDGVRHLLWEKKRKEIIPRNFFTILINETKKLRKSRKVESVIKASITNKRTNVILITKNRKPHAIRTKRFPSTQPNSIHTPEELPSGNAFRVLKLA